MNPIQRAGTFKARALSWSVRQISTGSVAIRVNFEVFEVRNGDVWSLFDRSLVHGDFFVYKQTGAANDKVQAMLRDMLGWDGLLASVCEVPPRDHIVQITVQSNESKGKTYYQAGWINDENAEPRNAAGDVSPDAAARLDAKFGRAKKPDARTTPPPATPDYGDIPF